MLVGLEPDCRSRRLPVGLALVLLANIRAWPALGLPLAVTVNALLVLVPLSSFSTPLATAELELVNVYRLLVAVTANVELSLAFLLSLPATEAASA